MVTVSSIGWLGVPGCHHGKRRSETVVWLTNAIYLVALLVLSPLILWRQLFGRRPIVGFYSKLTGAVLPRTSNADCIWFHAVSLGEVNVLKTVVNQWKQRFPNDDIAISTTTNTGMQRAKEIFGDEYVFFLPYDFSWAIKRVFARLRPTKIVLAELELWPNLVRCASYSQIPISIINGRLSEKSYRGYLRFRWLLAPLLKMLDLVGAQNGTYRKRFIALGADPDAVTVTGNIKFDNASDSAQIGKSQTCISANKPIDNEFIWVAGSTHDPEEQVVVDTYKSLKSSIPQLRLVIVPRHPERGNEICDLIQREGLSYVQRSNSTNTEITQSDSTSVIVIDTVGELTSWWQRADAAFVGGSMTARGGQNMIEPAALATPVCFGPNTWNFDDEVKLLLAHDGAVRVHSKLDLQEFIRQCSESKKFREDLATNASNAISSQVGATTRTIDLLAEITSNLNQQKKYAA